VASAGASKDSLIAPAGGLPLAGADKDGGTSAVTASGVNVGTGADRADDSGSAAAGASGSDAIDGLPSAGVAAASVVSFGLLFSAAGADEGSKFGSDNGAPSSGSGDDDKGASSVMTEDDEGASSVRAEEVEGTGAVVAPLAEGSGMANEGLFGSGAGGGEGIKPLGADLCTVAEEDSPTSADSSGSGWAALGAAGVAADFAGLDDEPAIGLDCDGSDVGSLGGTGASAADSDSPAAFPPVTMGVGGSLLLRPLLDASPARAKAALASASRVASRSSSPALDSSSAACNERQIGVPLSANVETGHRGKGHAPAGPRARQPRRFSLRGELRTPSAFL
jgi:hypothetical protein